MGEDLQSEDVTKDKSLQTSHVLERNINALVEKQIDDERSKSIEEKIADKVTNFTGNMAFVYTHIAVFGVWILWNVKLLGLKPFDSEFIGLQLVTAIEAIFLTTFVLMTQRGLDTQADKRADLDLQISLLSEHEITKLITLTKRIAEKLGIEEANDEEINELSKDVTPEKVMEKMESHKQNILRQGSIKQ